METFDVAKVDKVQGFQKFLYEIRDKSGGLVMSLIIPSAYKDLMLNPKLEDRDKSGGLVMSLIIPSAHKDLMLNPKLEEADETKDFYLYGWYNQCSFPIYIDSSLTDTIYIIGNLWTNKIKVHNG